MIDMAIRIAAASSDGKVVNRHFGAAHQFVIIDIDENGITFVETRKNEPPCRQGTHSDDLLLESTILLSDCKIVLASKIGPTAKSYLSLQGIDMVECGEFIEDAIAKLQQSGYINKQPKEA